MKKLLLILSIIPSVAFCGQCTMSIEELKERIIICKQMLETCEDDSQTNYVQGRIDSYEDLFDYFYFNLHE